MFRIYQHNAGGRISMGFTDGSNSDWYSSPDSDGDSLSGESTSDAWVNRVVDVGSFAAARVLSYLFIEDAQGSPMGSFDVAVADMVIISTDGTVTTLVGPGSVGSAPHDCGQVNGTGPTTCVTERVSNQADFPGSPQNTIYNLGDHLGTAQMEFVAGGWPVWQGQFGPFGEELDSHATTNHYKFTGKERDTESGLDYFGARYYASSMGRFMSPDWSAKIEPVPYSKLENPQSLNLYSYVYNNPLSRADADGHCPICIPIIIGVAIAESPAGQEAEEEAEVAAERYAPQIEAGLSRAGSFVGRTLAKAGEALEQKAQQFTEQSKNGSLILQGEATGAKYRVPDLLSKQRKWLAR